MTQRAAPALELNDDRLRRLFAYWLEKRGDRLFPAKAEIDPVEFSYILGYVTLVDVEPVAAALPLPPGRLDPGRALRRRLHRALPS